MGAAAAIGVVRYGVDRIDELASLHGNFSQVGGAVAMALVALQFAAKFEHWRDGIGRFAAPALTLTTLVAGLVAPDLTTPLFALWLILAIGLVIVWQDQTVVERLLRGSVVAIFLVNVLLVRRSPTLGPDISWHLFHTLIAVWMLGIWWLWSMKQGQAD